MIRKVTIGCLCLILCAAGWSQQGAAKSRVEKRADTLPKQLLDVLFATNEDCELFINDEGKGPVLKNEFRYLKLQPGAYRYKAKSKTTGDELTETFTVATNENNEVFMDLLYVQDLNAAERAKRRNEALGQPTALPASGKEPSGAKTGKAAALTSKEAQQETLNALASNLILLPGGSFTMGNNRAPVADEAEHPVILSGFYLSRFEVTQHQWESIMGYNPSINKGCPTCPVETVSWEEVTKFIRKLNSLSDKKFRLPTEAEWEYATRMGGKAEVEQAGGQEQYIKKTAWCFANANARTHPVGHRQPTASGFYDLTGNVSEWCADWYGAAYYKEERNQRNPMGPSLGKAKVVRGGNFKDYIGDRFRPSFRSKRLPTNKSSELGFRLAMDVPG